MSTTPEESQDTPAPESDFDELTGVYGFFRRHQMKLLYTAGLFTLLTFSIGGSIQGMVGGIFTEERERSTISVNGERVKLTDEDYNYGSRLARNLRAVPYGVMLQVLPGEGGSSELGEVLAIMRRAAIAEGIEPSLKEVDRAIEATREESKVESAAKLAVTAGFGSLAEYRQVVMEAMRIGMFTRLQLLALDTSDAEAMRQALLHQEKVSFKVATFDEQARQDEMKEKSELTDDDLKSWLEDQSERQKIQMGAFDLPTVKLRFAALLWGEGQFNPEEWTDGVLKDYPITDAQLKNYYDVDKDFFKIEDKDEYRPFDDEAVKAELTRMVQAERVMLDLNTKLKAVQTAVVQPFSDAVASTQNDFNTAQQSTRDAKKAEAMKDLELVDKEAELAKDLENAELKAAVEALKAEKTTLKSAAVAAEAAETAAKTALEAAQKAESDTRTGFDFVAEFNKLVEGKSGFVHKELDKQVTAEALQDLDALGLELGHWERSMAATSLRSAGFIGNAPGRTYKASVIYQALEMEAQPLKAWEELKPLCEDAYYTEKAVAEGREKVTAMTDALLRLAKEKIPEFVAERAKERQGRVDKAVEEWEAEVTADIAKSQEMLKTDGLGTKATQAWQRKLDSKQRELGAKDTRVTGITSLIDREIENEIKEEATKSFAEVLDAAAAETGYTVTEFGPLPRFLTQRPRFDQDYDATVVYTFLQHGEMEAGDAVGPVTDIAERRSHVITCKSVVPLTAEDLTRREFESIRKPFGTRQNQNGQRLAFTKEALEARYQLERPVAEQPEAGTQDE